MKMLSSLRVLLERKLERPKRPLVMAAASMIISVQLGLQGCADTSERDVSFSLPEGSPSQGKEVFTSLQCNACHSLPDVAQREDAGTNVSIRLGGEVRQIKTYSELLSAVVNPSHKILQGFSDRHKTPSGESAMRNYNDVMTVSELIDLVSFLQTQYQLKEFDRSQYRAYFPDQ